MYYIAKKSKTSETKIVIVDEEPSLSQSNAAAKAKEKALKETNDDVSYLVLYLTNEFKKEIVISDLVRPEKT